MLQSGIMEKCILLKVNIFAEENYIMTKLSVIIPIYNDERYIEIAVESVLKTAGEIVEIILVNDGSRDNSETVCHRLEEQNPRIRAITIPHSGVSCARNKGISLATGEYIAFLDVDDTWNTRIDLSVLISEMKSKAKMIGFSVYWCDETLKPLELRYAEKFSINEIGFSNVVNGMRYFACYLYRSDYLRESRHCFDEGIQFNEDMAFLTRCLYFSDSIRSDEVALVMHRCRKNSHSHNRYPGSGMEHIYKVWENNLSYFKRKAPGDSSIAEYCRAKMEEMKKSE